MVEILKSFEQVAGRFDPAVLMAPGLAMVVLGLVAWLAGMYLRRLTVALAGAVAGGIVGLLLGGPNPGVAGSAAAGGAAFGAILPRFAPAVFLAALAVAVALAFTGQNPAPQKARTMFGKTDFGQQQERLTAAQSLDVMRSCSLDLADHIKAIARPLEWTALAILAGVGLVLLALGLLLTRLAGAMVCSVLGTALIFAGMTALLILKGSHPITLMQQQSAFYGLVLLAMATFGTLEQLVLCPSPRRRTKVESRESPSQHEESGRHWRNH